MPDWARSSACRRSCRSAVSLVRRARDVAVGVPILLVWQFLEMRRLRAVQRVPYGGRN